MNNKINLIFLGGFPYPHGMAGTRRIQNAINRLKHLDNIFIKVIILRQPRNLTPISGKHNNIPYETVMGDFSKTKLLLFYPIFQLKAKQAIVRAFRESFVNILYVYGPPSFENSKIIKSARRIGYKVIFDLVEDYDLASDISKSLWHKIKIYHIKHTINKIGSMADAIIVISSHLKNKFTNLTSNKVPIHLLPITVDCDNFSNKKYEHKTHIDLFYSGSFGIKDGVPILIEAFDNIASIYKNVRLVLTGKGSKEAMSLIFSRIEASPHKDRIEYKGYLSEENYYNALNSADIPCMTRIDSGYANAGFPFKLGEYLATGKPVIASSVSDVPSLLRNYQDAILVKPGCNEDIEKAISFILNNRDKANTIGKQGRERAHSLFDHKTQGASLLNFINSL